MKKCIARILGIFCAFAVIFCSIQLVSAKDILYPDKYCMATPKTVSGRAGISFINLGEAYNLPFSIPINVNTNDIDKIKFYLDVSEYANTGYSQAGRPMFIYIYLVTDDNRWYQFRADKNRSSSISKNAGNTLAISQKSNYKPDFKGDIFLDISAFYDVDTVIEAENLKAIYLNFVMVYGCKAEIFMGDIYAVKNGSFMLADFSTFDNFKQIPTTEKGTQTLTATPSAEPSTAVYVTEPCTNITPSQTTRSETTTKFKGTGKNYITENTSEFGRTQNITEGSLGREKIFDEKGNFSDTKSGNSYEIVENKNGYEPFLWAGIFTVLIGSSAYLMNKKSVKKSFKEGNDDE